jgi:hypothetical protein
MKFLKRCKHCANTGFRICSYMDHLWGGYTIQKCGYCIHGKKITDQMIEDRLFRVFRGEVRQVGK